MQQHYKIYTLLLLCLSSCSALSTIGNHNKKNVISQHLQPMTTTTTAPTTPRRDMLLQTALIAAATATTALTSSSPPANAAAATSAFVGTFSDPINHPGGTRTIQLLEDQKVGEYQLAQVLGGGGIGEPKSYILPAVIIGNRAIIIDFSPKGGPKDFTGVLDGKGGDIKFLRDGNRWPRLSSSSD